MRAASPGDRRTRRPLKRGFVAATAAFAAFVALGTWGLIVKWNQESQAHWRARLSSEATDRQMLVEALVQKWQEDAHAIAAFPSVVTAVDRGAARSDVREAPSQHLKRILEEERRLRGYVSLSLFDGTGREVQHLGEEGGEASADLARGVIAARRSGLSERGEANGEQRILVGFPVQQDQREERARGAVVLVVDPARDLWPLLNREAIPSDTGETVLMRREGNDVVFLSPLRLRRGAGPVRVPVATPMFAAAEALAGREGIGTFRDYRGVSVLAATRPIRGTEWGLVRKIDLAEATADAHRGAWMLAAMSALLVCGFAGILRSLSWRQIAREAQTTAAHELALRSASARYQLLSDHANDILLFVGPQGRILDANRAAESIYGRSAEELRAMDITDLRPPDLRDTLTDQLQEALEKGIVYETVHVRRDGTSFPVEVSATGAVLDGDPIILAILRDVGARKRRVAHIEHLQSVLTAVLDVNQMIVREEDRGRLLQGTCDLLRRGRSYELVWIGVPVPEGKRVVPVAISGADASYLRKVVITWDEAPTGRGPSGTAIRTRRPCVVRSIANDERVAPWRAAALARSYASSAALPIAQGESLYGVLSVYASEENAFDVAEMRLLERLAGDVAYALHALETRAEQRRGEEALRESESRYRRLSEELENRVVERTAALDAANRELEAFNYSVSHDLRAPLRHIQGFIDALREDHAAVLPPRAREFVDRVAHGSSRMTELIDGLLVLSRVGRADLRPRNVDLGTTARQAFEELASPADRERIELVVDPLPPVVADAALLRQLLDNLIGNAIKFTRPIERAHIEVGHSSASGQPVFFVRDDGVGFDPEYSGKLFHVFQRLHTEAEFEGTGVGLSIAKRIVERHGGRIWAEGSPGRGATFYFTLPASPPDGEPS